VKPIQKSHLTLHGTEAILQEAFQNAKKRFTKGLTSHERKKIWAEEKTTMRDVERAIAVAMATYEAKPKSKARIWLRKSEARMWLIVVSGKIMYYGNIIDILLQRHSENVSLM
jgi:hypothetical protein